MRIAPPGARVCPPLPRHSFLGCGVEVRALEHRPSPSTTPTVFLLGCGAQIMHRRTAPLHPPQESVFFWLRRGDPCTHEAVERAGQEASRPVEGSARSARRSARIRMKQLQWQSCPGATGMSYEAVAVPRPRRTDPFARCTTTKSPKRPLPTHHAPRTTSYVPRPTSHVPRPTPHVPRPTPHRCCAPAVPRSNIGFPLIRIR
jgi:hypothetical protein